MAGSLSTDLLVGYPINVRIPVQWGEMDAYGHLNNAVFFRYFESARIRYLEACGFIASYEEDKIGAILHSTSCRFRLPLFYPDTVVVGTRADSVEADRFSMSYKVVSLAREAVVAEGAAIVVSFDYVARVKVRIPDRIRELIQELEAEPSSTD